MATWSLRMRAVCRRPAAAPMSSRSRPPRSCGCPRARARRRSRRPRSLQAVSALPGSRRRRSLMIPWRQHRGVRSAAAMSSAARRLSKPIEALIACITVGPAAKRPPHMAWKLLVGHASPALQAPYVVAALPYAGSHAWLLTPSLALDPGDARSAARRRDAQAGGACRAGSGAGCGFHCTGTAARQRSPPRTGGDAWSTSGPPGAHPAALEMPSLDSAAGGARRRRTPRSSPIATGRNSPEAIARFFAEFCSDVLPTALDPKSALGAGDGRARAAGDSPLDRDGGEVARLLGGAEWHSPEAAAVLDYLAGLPG